MGSREKEEGVKKLEEREKEKEKRKMKILILD